MNLPKTSLESGDEEEPGLILAALRDVVFKVQNNHFTRRHKCYR